MLRIRLGVDDLARVRLAVTGVAATIEAVYSSFAIRRADTPLLYGDWARALRARLGAECSPLFNVVPGPSQMPLFMIKRTDDPAEFAEHVLAAPTPLLRTGLRTPHTPFARRLATGDRAARQALATAITSYHRAFADTVPTMRAMVHTDLVHRSTVLATTGLGGLFTTLHPGMRWRSPVLEIDSPVDGDIDLAGRPLQLTPSVFMRHGIGVLVEPRVAFVTYPVRGAARLGGTPGDPLVELLGKTRATVLRTLWTGCSTTELAELTGVSLASASAHAAVLRRAGLVETYREGRSVRHQLTPLGQSTLSGDVL